MKTDNKKKCHKKVLNTFLIDNEIRVLNEENISDWLKEFVKVFGLTGATLYLISDGSSEHLGDYNNRVDLLTDVSLNHNYEGISEVTVEREEPLVFNNRTNKKSYDPDTDYSSIASFPIKKGEEIVGVLNLGSDKVDYFDKKLVEEINSSSELIGFFLDASLKLSAIPNLEKRINNYTEKYKEIKTEVESVNLSKEKLVRLADKINFINNQLSIIAGNIQCLSVENSSFNQKERQRIKRIETSSTKIYEAIEEIKSPV